MSPNLHPDPSLVFVGVVLWWVSCVVALVHSGLLRGSSFEDFTPGCPILGARDSWESTPWLVVCSDHQWYGCYVSSVYPRLLCQALVTELNSTLVQILLSTNF